MEKHDIELSGEYHADVNVLLVKIAKLTFALERFTENSSVQVNYPSECKQAERAFRNNLVDILSGDL
jgi:hypothetical protein